MFPLLPLHLAPLFLLPLFLTSTFATPSPAPAPTPTPQIPPDGTYLISLLPDQTIISFGPIGYSTINGPSPTDTMLVDPCAPRYPNAPRICFHDGFETQGGVCCPLSTKCGYQNGVVVGCCRDGRCPLGVEEREGEVRGGVGSGTGRRGVGWGVVGAGVAVGVVLGV